jgi:ABC-type branched-subunit amino acid transport system substrate-binding protein
MGRKRRWSLLLALFAVFALVAAACGDDDDDEGDVATGEESGEEAPAEGEAEGGEINLDEEVEVAPGTVLPLPDCPSDWDPEEGLTEDTIKVAISLPESGPVAALGGIDDGARAYFEAIEPIDGRRIELVSRDDAYDPARTLSNTEEIIETERPFALTAMVGTPNNLAIRDLTDEECIPQLFNATGFPAWGDPANYPWTVGSILPYNAEANLWCTFISEEVGEGATVAALIMDNDFGASYRDTLEACSDEGTIDLVESVTHDPAAPDVTDEVTTLLAAGSDAIVLGTTGAACPQSMAALAAGDYAGLKLLSYTCQGIPTYFKPIDPAGEGVIVTKSALDASDEATSEEVARINQILRDAGLDPLQGAFFTGAGFATIVENIFRAAAELEGGLNRVNLMRAVWNADYVSPVGLPGTTARTNGVEDAYFTEAAQFSRYVPPAAGEEVGHYEPVGELIDAEGETGSFSG